MLYFFNRQEYTEMNISILYFIIYGYICHVEVFFILIFIVFTVFGSVLNCLVRELLDLTECNPAVTLKVK